LVGSRESGADSTADEVARSINCKRRKRDALNRILSKNVQGLEMLGADRSEEQIFRLDPLDFLLD
jgi:hypothetical protein